MQELQTAANVDKPSYEIKRQALRVIRATDSKTRLSGFGSPESLGIVTEKGGAAALFFEGRDNVRYLLVTADRRIFDCDNLALLNKALRQNHGGGLLRYQAPKHTFEMVEHRPALYAHADGSLYWKNLPEDDASQ